MWHWFPEGVSTYAADVDSIFMLILWITGIIFVLVETTLLIFVFRYRHRPGRRALHIHGDNRLEVVWTLIPFMIVVGIAAVSVGPWMRLRNPDRFPPPGLQVEVTAKQFEWNVRYPGPDGQLGTTDDFTSRNTMQVPVNRPVHVMLQAEDVIHSFFLPAMRVKQDAVPGMQIPIWFEATEVGEYVIGCAELCGLGHYRMRGTLQVVDALAFDRWNESGGRLAVDRDAGTRDVAAAPSQHSGH
jgi:cytochrome c oxidase subunit 2